MTTQYLVRMNDNFVEQLKNFAKEMGEELSIILFDEKKYLIKQNTLLSIPKLDVEDDFF